MGWNVLNNEIIYPQILSLDIPCPQNPVKPKSVAQTLLREFKPQGTMLFKVCPQ